MVDLPATNDPLSPELKWPLVRLYKVNPLLKMLMENARIRPDADIGLDVGDDATNYVVGIDAAAGPSSSPKQLRNAPAELRPPPEHDDKAFHWCEHPARISKRPIQEAIAWVSGQWLIAGDGTAHSTACMAAAGWRYLGPAEWPTAHAETARIAELEAEVALLRANPPLIRFTGDDTLYRWDADAGRWVVKATPAPDKSIPLRALRPGDGVPR